jgi:hypothetical protein
VPRCSEKSDDALRRPPYRVTVMRFVPSPLRLCFWKPLPKSEEAKGLYLGCSLSRRKRDEPVSP